MTTSNKKSVRRPTKIRSDDVHTSAQNPEYSCCHSSWLSSSKDRHPEIHSTSKLEDEAITGTPSTYNKTTMLSSRFARVVSRASKWVDPSVTTASTVKRSMAGFPSPRLFDYETITSNLSVADAVDSVEQAFGALARGKVDVPMPMHIGIDETETAGPGDCHIKGTYLSSS